MDNEKKLIRIKRYSTRKLYDTSQSRYITLTELGEIVRGGANVIVIDNDTKADLTDMTLTQVLIAQQKQKQNGIKNLVQTQAEMLLQRLTVPVQQIRDEAVRQVEKQLEKIKRIGEPHVEDPANHKDNTKENSNGDCANAEDDDECPATPAKPSLDLKLEALKASSDEKLISLMLVQRLEELEREVADLRHRLELLERKDDEMY